MLVKYLMSALVAFSVLMAGSVMAEQPLHFISVIDDLPLMSELQEVGDGVQFSTPQGRIAEVTTQGRVSQAQVLAFYEQTLPQLGWAPVASGRFVREGETLELLFAQKGQMLNVSFSLAPTFAKK
jgi:hypothetical protein